MKDDLHRLPRARRRRSVDQRAKRLIDGPVLLARAVGIFGERIQYLDFVHVMQIQPAVGDVLIVVGSAELDVDLGVGEFRLADNIAAAHLQCPVNNRPRMRLPRGVGKPGSIAAVEQHHGACRRLLAQIRP